jgi:hypothetical protein
MPVVAAAAIAALIAWLIGPLALRVAGLLLMLARLFGAAIGQPQD